MAKDSISTPLRLVYNASSRASSEEASLNQCLMRGPNLTEKLLNTLARFRTEKYAYSADISKAFLRLGLQECDRDFTRFLWSENPHDPNARLVSYRFKSVLFGATSSPFLLQVTLDLHFKTSKGQYREEIRRNMYVDNLLGTTSCEQKLIELYTEANFELENADMPLTAWSTNSPALTKQLQTDLKSESPFSHHQNILGMNWDITTDSISIKALEPNVRKPTTKRELLSRVSSLFDPLGLVSPLTIQGKLLVQAAWQLNVSWDQRLPEAFMEGWQEIEVSLASAERFNVPRTVVHSTDHPELHIFCDASNKAYGACAYIVTDNNSNILTSKAKVAPLKTRTLPQLELMALLVGARLAKYIKHTLDNIQFSQTYLWSDNEACIQWVKNNRSQITFVKNRVAEIRELTPNIIIQHVSSKENPADLLTRGVTPDVLEDSTLWFEGPIWLSHKAEWPIQKEILVAIQTIGAVGTSAIPYPLPILVIAHFSSYQKLINVTRQVFKFLLLIKPNLRLPSPFMYWIRQSQEEYYPGIFKILNKEISPLKSDLNLKAVIDLGLYEDKDLGVLRSRGRLKHADLSSGTKFPLLLPNKSKLAELLISATHEWTHHSGTQDVLTAIRQYCWIPKGRQLVKTIIKRCTLCRRFDAKPLNNPGPPVLPVERVINSRPFENTGVDYTGAILIKGILPNELTKVYICLFTCMVTRNVHLEVASDLSATTFLNIFRKFVANCSLPQIIVSDHGTNLSATAKFLETIMTDEVVNNYMVDHAVKWKFIHVKSPWEGGFYERMIEVTKVVGNID